MGQSESKKQEADDIARKKSINLQNIQECEDMADGMWKQAISDLPDKMNSDDRRIITDELANGLQDCKFARQLHDVTSKPSAPKGYLSTMINNRIVNGRNKLVNACEIMKKYLNGEECYNGSSESTFDVYFAAKVFIVVFLIIVCIIVIAKLYPYERCHGGSNAKCHMKNLPQYKQY